ncbi:MAG: YqgE/AlgH family protein [Chitinophagaceae bacterium]
MIKPAAGILLIADPFLKDPHFMRTVVFLCDHQNNGTVGFVLSKVIEQTLEELMNNMEDYPVPVYFGGPVQLDTIHFIHQYPDLIPDSFKVGEGIYWGGNFETVTSLIKAKQIDLSKIKFFLGYSGWGDGQLEAELKEKSWITATATSSLVFETDPTDIWKESLKHLGGDYEKLVHYPTDPQLN